MAAASLEQRAPRRQEIRRRGILMAAAEEFARVGYDSATLEKIGDRVGLSKASLYYYVESKEQLLVALLAEVTSRIADEAGLAESATPTARLRAFVAAHARVTVSTAEGKVLAENLDALMTRSASTELAELRDRHERLLTDILHEGIRTGEFQEVAVRPTVKLLFGALNGIPRWFDADGPMKLDDVLDEALDILVTGLGKR